MKSKDLYADLAGCAETIFATSNYEVGRPLTIGKDKLGGRIIETFVVSRRKRCTRFFKESRLARQVNECDK